jgi:hypothetical protein
MLHLRVVLRISAQAANRWPSAAGKMGPSAFGVRFRYRWPRYPRRPCADGGACSWCAPAEAARSDLFAGRGAPAPAAACTPVPSSARSAGIWTMSTTRAVSDLAVMSPKPAVVEGRHAGVHGVRAACGWVRSAAEARSIMKYVEACRRTPRQGAVSRHEYHRIRGIGSGL